MFVFFFKQKTAYELRISDWSSDVCSSDLFCITPDAPETGYGWIAQGEPIVPGVHRVERFVEKPPRDRAEAMLAAGGHYWNGGIFLFRADMFLGALAVHAPDMLAARQQALDRARSEEHTPDLQSPMRISYA